MLSDKYLDMAKILRKRSKGNYTVERFTLTKQQVERAQIRAAMSFSYGEVAYLRPGKYVRLTNGDGTVIMSNTQMELMTNLEFLRAARGHVLIGGLGIGLIILPVMLKDEVRSVTVIEREQDIIDIVAPQLPLNGKVTILQGDVDTWEPDMDEGPAYGKFDTLYFDIWNSVCGDNWEHMKALTRRYRKYRRPGAWLSHWRKRDTQERAY